MIIAMLLALQNLPEGACVTAPFGWTCQAIWVASLPPREQRVALLSFEAALKLDTKDRLIPAIRSKTDFCWVTSVNGFGYGMLSMGATKNPDIKAFLGYSGGIYTKVLNGRLTMVEGQTLIEARRPLNKIGPMELEALVKAFPLKMHRAENALVAFAKVAASELSDCKK